MLCCHLTFVVRLARLSRLVFCPFITGWFVKGLCVTFQISIYINLCWLGRQSDLFVYIFCYLLLTKMRRLLLTSHQNTEIRLQKLSSKREKRDFFFRLHFNFRLTPYQVEVKFRGKKQPPKTDRKLSLMDSRHVTHVKKLDAVQTTAMTAQRLIYTYMYMSRN